MVPNSVPVCCTSPKERKSILVAGDVLKHCAALGSLHRLNAAQRPAQWVLLARLDTYRQDLAGKAMKRMNIGRSTPCMAPRILPVKLAPFLGLASRRWLPWQASLLLLLLS